LRIDGQMHEAVAAIAATGVSPVVRIPANEAWMAKREYSVSAPECMGLICLMVVL
jgi:4-hydroxy-2-oxoheptanedioate aldolase